MSEKKLWFKLEGKVVPRVGAPFYQAPFELGSKPAGTVVAVDIFKSHIEVEFDTDESYALALKALKRGDR